MMGEPRHRVVIAGAGVGGLETLALLRSLAADGVDITVIDPGSEFVVQALSVEDPFARAAPRRYPLAGLCADHSAPLVRDGLARVEDHVAVTTHGERIGFDSLVVAVGARRLPAYSDALTFRDLRDAERMHGVVFDMESGHLDRIAFVVPPGITWPLPLYELALLTADRADGAGRDDVSLIFVTPETAPLEAFGDAIGLAVAQALASAGVELRPRTSLADLTGLDAQCVIALPRLEGPRIEGLACDEHGFLYADENGRAEGRAGVYVIGDAATEPVKQGGLAAHQAAIVANEIAAAAGFLPRPVETQAVLRAKLLTGGDPWFLRRALGDGVATATTHALWWPPTKVVAPHLAAHLEGVDADRSHP